MTVLTTMKSIWKTFFKKNAPIKDLDATITIIHAQSKYGGVSYGSWIDGYMVKPVVPDDAIFKTNELKISRSTLLNWWHQGVYQDKATMAEYLWTFSEGQKRFKEVGEMVDSLFVE